MMPWLPVTLHEAARPSNVSRLGWEQRWEKNAELREALEDVRKSTVDYAGVLGDICDAKGLLVLATHAKDASS